MTRRTKARLTFAALAAAILAWNAVQPVPRAPGVCNIADYGADPADPAKTVAAIERASDDAGQGGVVEIPSGTWPVPRPAVARHNGQSWRGPDAIDNPYSKARARVVNLSGGPAFLVSPSFRLPFSADHRVDSFGKLDASVAPAPRCAWGITSKLTHFLSDFEGPLAWDQTWSDNDRITLEWCADSPVMPSGTPIMGAGRWEAPRPLYLYHDDGGAIGGVLASCSTPGGPATAYRFSFSPALGAGLHRVTLDVDLAAGTVTAWVDDVAQAVVGGTMPPGRHWCTTAPGASWNFWAADSGQADWNSPPGLRSSATLHGFRVTSGGRYRTVAGKLALAPGQPGPLNDAWRYGGPQADGAHLVSSYYYAAPPAEGVEGQFVLTWSGSATGSQYFHAVFCPSAADLAAAPEGPVLLSQRFLNLSIQGGSFSNHGLAIGQVLDVTVEGCSVAGTRIGLGSTGGIGACYVIDVVRSTVWGGCAWIYAHNWYLRANDLGWGSVVRYGLLLNGCNSWVRGIYFKDEGATTTAHVYYGQESEYGNAHVLRDLMTDREGDGFPSLGVVVAERPNSGISLSAENIGAGPMPGGRPQIRLVDRPDVRRDAQPGLFFGRNLLGATVAAPPGWQVSLDPIDRPPPRKVNDP